MRYLVLLMLLPLVISCETNPSTQTMLMIDVEPEILRSAARVEVRVTGGIGRRLLDERTVFNRVLEVSGTDPQPPWIIALAPEAGALDRAYGVLVLVRDSDEQVLVRQGLVSSYVSGRVLRLDLRITSACLAVSCPDYPTTCVSGTCSDPWVDPTSLPEFTGESNSQALSAADGGS